MVEPQVIVVIKNFKHVHLGISIETATALNDYIRYPSEITSVLANIEQFVELRKQYNLHLALRITPSVLSIYHIDTIFELMIKHKIVAESCNILYDPSALRMELMSDLIRQQIIDKIQRVIDRHNIVEHNDLIINRRRDDLVDTVIASVIYEYKTFIENYIVPNNIKEERTNLVKFLKAFESLRNNTILDYLPEYEEFLSSNGY